MAHHAALVLIALLLATACREEKRPLPAPPAPLARETTPAAFGFGFAPVHSLDLAAAWGRRLERYLARHGRVRIKPFIASSYRSLVEALAQGRVTFGWVSPAVFVGAMRSGKARPLAQLVHWGKGSYYSALVVRADSPIRKLGDLRGRRVAWVDPRSTSGYLYPRLLLRKAALDPDALFVKHSFLGGHAAVLGAVLDRFVDVGATYCSFGPRGELIGSAWSQLVPTRARELRVLDSVGPIPSDVVVAHESAPPAAAAAIQGALLRMHEDAEGRALLERFFTADRMVPANEGDYRRLAEIIDSIAGK